MSDRDYDDDLPRQARRATAGERSEIDRYLGAVQGPRQSSRMERAMQIMRGEQPDEKPQRRPARPEYQTPGNAAIERIVKRYIKGGEK